MPFIRSYQQMILVILLLIFGLVLFTQMGSQVKSFRDQNSRAQLGIPSFWKAPPKDEPIFEERVTEADLVDSREWKILPVATTAQPETKEQSLGRQLKPILGCKDRGLQIEKYKYGEYWVVRNYVRGSVSTNVKCSETLTYTTIGDYSFFKHLEALALHWLAPISFAIYAPGYDINGTLSSMQYVRNCLKASDLIRQYVSFHVFFPAEHMPKYLPLTEAEAMAWPYDCAAPPPYENVDRAAMYKTAKNLTYPINVARNVARKAANTYFILASDIELIPSGRLVEQFLSMVARNTSLIPSERNPRVFTIPVFELNENATIPSNKTELKALLKQKMAIPFHSYVCKTCHLVIDQKKWTDSNDSASDLSVTAVGKRTGKFGSWEPFYISDNKEPMFDDRVTWEGQSNKRIQAYAMCLLDYDFYVIHPAFLVHSPGIKRFDKAAPRLKFVPNMNNKIKYTIQPEYKILYGENKLCHM